MFQWSKTNKLREESEINVKTGVVEKLVCCGNRCWHGRILQSCSTEQQNWGQEGIKEGKVRSKNCYCLHRSIENKYRFLIAGDNFKKIEGWFNNVSHMPLCLFTSDKIQFMYPVFKITCHMAECHQLINKLNFVKKNKWIRQKIQYIKKEKALHFRKQMMFNWLGSLDSRLRQSNTINLIGNPNFGPER